MRIDRLRLQNFRCFADATFEFSPGFNLFVGSNGSGKSSLLCAVTASLAPLVKAYGIKTAWPHAHKENARLALMELGGRTRYERHYPVRLEADGEVTGHIGKWSLEQTSKEGPTSWDNVVFAPLRGLAAAIVKGEAGALPVVAFYSVGRNWHLDDVIAEQAIKNKDFRLDAYTNWHNASSDAKALGGWITAKSLERLEQLAAGKVPHDEREPDELDLINQAVARAIPGSKGLHYDLKTRRLLLEWKAKEPTPFAILSDGQRSIAALVADIARRMALLNPQLGDDVLTQTPGVVVIDELDMHLHPAWQRRLPGVLKAVFPRVQFIAAAHSPQMMGELAPDEIWLMRDAEVLGHPDRSLGLSSNEVLEELMDTDARNPEVARELAELRRLIDDDQLEPAQQRLDALRERVGDIPDVVRAQAAIQSLQWMEDDEE